MTNRRRARRSQGLRVMQSFGKPRSTTNPYIHMLDESLAHEPSIEHLRFNHKRALLGSYDVLHFHWPETLLGGTSRAKRLARRLYASALLLRLRLGRVVVVRTVHNVDLPTEISRWERWFLQGIEDQTAYRILLNANSHSQCSKRSCVIPHGHYVDWFSHTPKVEAEQDTLGFVGLIRQYKGVEGLISAFRDTQNELSETVLRVSGNPTSVSMRHEVEQQAKGDNRIELDLRYLSEEDFATAIMRMRGVILPYRFMHNSGAVLAVLSLARPVLVPDNDTNRDLAEEVGPGWLHFFSDDLSSDDIVNFREAVFVSPTKPPALEKRAWSDVGRRHAEAYAAASNSNE